MADKMQRAMTKDMRELCKDIAETETPLKDLVGSFPRVIWTPDHEQGVSIHLCASDTRRIGPDPTREVTIWLTIVDLTEHNPINVSRGGTLTPWRKEDDREMYQKHQLGVEVEGGQRWLTLAADPFQLLDRDPVGVKQAAVADEDFLPHDAGQGQVVETGLEHIVQGPSPCFFLFRKVLPKNFFFEPHPTVL